METTMTTPKCWQCKKPMVWKAKSESRLWTPKWVCPKSCGPKLLSQMFRVR